MRLASVVGNAACTQIENRIRIELAGGGAVTALDVVGVDLEFRLGVYLRRARKQQVLVARVVHRT